MSNIILKAHSANQTVAEVVLKPGTTTKIKAQKQVNYELLQEASGRAPDHIVTKRVGKDLHINLDGQEGDDLIIEGFYNSKDTALIGLAEDGQYYYYIPDTADFADYVTELAAGDVTGQALGGQPYSAPWWMGATTEGSILPWLAGIVTGFLVTADDKEKPAVDAVNVTANQDGSVTVDLPKTAETGEKVTVEVTNPNGTAQTVELTKEQDGSWTSSNPSVVPSVPAGSNSTTIANDQVKDGSTVTATDKNGQADSVVAANPTPDAPKVSAPNDETGAVTVELPTNNVEPGDTVEISYTKPNGEQATATVTKQPDGSWTSSNPAITIGTNADGNPTATIPNTEVKDNTDVTATAKDGVTGQTSAPATNKSGNPTPDAPKVSTPNDETGVVTVELPTNNVEPGDQVVVSYTKPDGTPATTTLTKQPDGTWSSDNPAVTVGTDANGKPVATFPNKEVKDNTPVTAVSKDAATGEASAPSTNQSGDPVPTAPVIIADETNGGAWVVDFPEDAEVGDKVAIKFTDPNGNDVEVIFTKTGDEPAPSGTWTSNDPRLTFDPTTGSVKVPDELVKDGTSVSGTSYNRDDVNNENGNDSKPATTADLPPGKPEVLPPNNETGDVVIKLPTENVEPGDTVTIEYTKPDGTKGEATLTKTEDGWQADPNNPDVTLDKDNDGKADTDANGNPIATIPGDKVKDNTPVTATANDKTTEKGDVVIKLPTENVETGDTVKVEYTKPDGTKGEATLTKTEDGWQADPNNPDVTLDKDNDGKADTDANGNPIATIPGDKVQDGTVATVTNPDGTTSTVNKPTPSTGTGTSGNPEPTAAEVIANPDGSVTIKLPEDAETGDAVKVIYTNKDGETVVTTVVKDKDGTWKDTDPNTTIDGNTLTIPNEAIKDGTEVTAVSVDASKANIPTDKDGNYIAPDVQKNPTEEELQAIKDQGKADTKPTADVLPSSPVVDIDEAVGVRIIDLPKDAENGDKVVVKYTDPNGNDKIAVVEKTPDGWKPVNDSPVVAELPTDVAEGTKATVTYKDPTGAEKEATLTFEDGEWKADPNNPDVEVGKDADGKPVAKLPIATIEAGSDVTVAVEGKDPVTITTPDSDLTVEKEVNGDEYALLPNDKVKDGTPVTAHSVNAADKIPEDGNLPNNNPSNEAEAPNPTPTGTEVIAPTDGSGDVIIKLPTNNVEPGDTVKVEYTKPDGTKGEATLTKTPEGWAADPSNPDVTLDKDGDGKADTDANGNPIATIPGDKVKDNTPITVTSGNGDGTGTPEVKEDVKSGDQDPEAPVVTAVEDKVTIKLPEEGVEIGDYVKVGYTDVEGNGKIAAITLTKDGWVSNDPNIVVGEDGKVATIDKSKLQPGSEVVAVTINASAQDDEGKTASDKVEDATKEEIEGLKDQGKADQDGVDNQDVAPAQPTVVADDAKGVTVTMPTENVEPGDKVTVSFTKPGETTPTDVVYTAQPDGTWKVDPADAKDATDAGLPETVAEGGEVTVPNDKVKDGSPVTAVATDAAHPNETGNTANAPDLAPAQPTVVADEAKGVTVTMPTENVEPGDKVTVGFTKPGETTPTEVTYTAQPDGTWKAEPADAAKDAGLPETVAKGGEVTVPNDKVKDGSPVTAVASDDTHPAPMPEEGKNKVTAPDLAPAQPTVVADDAKGVTVTMPTENVEPGDKVTVGFTKPGEDKPTEVVYTAQPDGTWKAEPADAAKDAGLPETVAKGGEVTVPNDKVKDGSPVTAVATDAAHPNETGNTANAPDLAPAQPTVVADEAKGVTVTMPTENVEPGDKVTVGFTKPGETTPTEVTYTAQPDGTWKAEPADAAKDAGLPETVAKGGEVVIPNDKVKDGSPVTAVASDATNPAPMPEEGKNKVTAPDLAPEQPTVEANPTTGDVTVTMPTENVEPGDKVTVSFTKPGEDKPTEVVYTAQPDGTWKAEPADAAKDAGLPETVAKGGEVTVPNDKVKDGSPVTAVASDDTHPAPAAEEGKNKVNAPDLAPEQPTVEANPTTGDVTVTMPTENVEPGDKVTVSFTKPGEDKPTEVVYTAQPDGTWKVDPTDAADAKDAGLPEVVAEGGEVVLPNDKVKDNTPVTAVATDETNTNPTVDDKNSAITPQISPTGLTLDPKENGDVAVNLPTTNAEPGDKVDVKVVNPATGKEETVTLTKQPDGTWESDKPSVVPSTTAENPNTTTIPNDKVKDGSKVEAVAYDEGTQPDWTGDDVADVTAADPKPTGLTANYDKDGNLVVNLPTNNVEPTDKVVVTVTAPDGTETPYTFEKTEDGWKVDPADKGITIKGDTATIPKDILPEHSEAKAETINGADNKPAEEDTASNKVQTGKPTVQDIFAIDTSNPADEQAEAVKVTGKTVDPNSLVEIVYKGEVIGSGRSDDEGNFEITTTPKEGVTLTKDEPFEVYATDTENNKLRSEKADDLDVLGEDGLPTGEKAPIAVPEVVDGPEGHIGDRIAPKQPTLEQGADAGSVVLTFPTEDTAGQPVQNGDIVEVNFTDEQGNKHIVLFEKVDGGWQSNNPELVPGDGGNGLVTTPSVTIPADKLQDASTVAAQTRDIAGNESEWEYENAGSDEDQGLSPDPSIDSVVSYDTSTQADRNPEYVHIQGSAVYPASADPALAGKPVSSGTVTISFPEFIKDGKPVSITVKTDENGKFQLIAKESDSTPLKDEHKGIDALSLNDAFDIVAFTKFEMYSHDTARGFLSSDNSGHVVTSEVLPVLDGAAYHIGDKALPEQPTLTPADSGIATDPDGGMKVGLPQSANAGDKVIVEFTDEESKPQKVTLTKQDDGSWKSSNSLLVPDVAPRTDEATIPEDNLLDGSMVEAYSEDLAGNIDKNAAGDIIKVSASAGSDDYDPEKTATPTYSSIEAKDTAGDIKPETVTIVGKTEPKAVVVVSKDGVEVGRVTADENGDFTLNIDNANGTLAMLNTLKMVATAPDKLPSDAADVQVPRILMATAPLITPNEGGSVIILPQGDNTTVIIKYFDENNVEKTTVVTKDPESGLWNISGDNTKTDGAGATVHDETAIDFNPVTGGVTIYEPALQDVTSLGNATTVTATGNNGNHERYNRTTSEVVRAVSGLNFEDVYAKDTDVAANDEPEELYFTIKTNAVTSAEQINTKVEIISPDGTIYDVQNIVEDKKLDGTVGITIRENGNDGLDLKVGSIVRVTQTTADREPTTKFFSIPELGQGEKYHTDVTPPDAPKVTTDGKGAGVIALPTGNTHPGDTVVVSIVPTGQQEPTTVTLTKVPNGWISDNPALVPSTVGQEDPNKVVIPHENIQDDTDLVAKSVGTEGKSSAPDLVRIESNIEPVVVQPKTEAPTLLGEPNEATGEVKVGEVKVRPHADNDAMQITYPVEYGNGRTEIVLAQKGADGKWKLSGNTVDLMNQNGEKLVTINEDTGEVTLHHDALADHQTVTAIGLKTGKQPSDVASVIAGSEPQSIGEFWGTINELLPSSPTAGRQDGQDVGVWRNGLQGEDDARIGNGTYGKSTALVSLVNQLQAANDYASESVGTVGSRTSYTLNTNEQDNIVRIYNSLGNMNTNSMDHSGVVTVNTHDGNDAIVIGRDLGFSGTTPSGDRYMTVNTGEGQDVITVGATNDWFKVVQYYDYNDITKRYDKPGIVDVIPYDAQLPQNARYLPNLDLYNDVNKARRTGGHLANANVNMGDGDDALVVSGVDSVSSAAISWSTINMGDGHNRVIVAPNGVDSSVEIRGAIAQGAVIRGGKDTDYVQAPLVSQDARIELGAGNDTVKLTKVADTAQVIMGAGNDVAELRDVVNSAVIDMGAGNDIVTMTGSFSNSAVVRLGDGDDRFNWGFKTSGGGVVDGGAGYDTISLQGYGAGDSSPVGWRASTPVSNIKTADFKNIEEIVMNGNNALDIRFADIRDTSTHTFTLDNGEAKRAKFIVSANKERDSVVDGRIGSNKVDFGQTDWNRDSDRDLSDTSAGSGGRWGDVGDVRLNGKTYDIFRHTSVGGSHEYDVLVEQGITII